MRQILSGILIVTSLLLIEGNSAAQAKATSSSTQSEQKALLPPPSSTGPSGTEQSDTVPTGVSIQSVLKDPRLWTVLALISLSAAVLLLSRKLSFVPREFRDEIDRLTRRLDGVGDSAAGSQVTSLTQGQQDLSNRLLSVQETLRRQSDELLRVRTDYKKGFDDQGYDIGTLGEKLDKSNARVGALDSRVVTLEHRSLESYFEEWKVAKLRDRLLEDTKSVFTQFANNPDNQSAIAESRSALEKTAEKATIWFAAVATCHQELRNKLAALGGETLVGTTDRLGDYVTRGQQFISHLRQSISDSDLTTVERDLTERFDFLDIAMGRVAQAQSEYSAKLAARVQGLQQAASAAPESWMKLRAELLEILDQFYSQFESISADKSSVTAIDSNIRSALKQAKIQEIQIESNRTSYDPTLHESLAGARLTRSDLPDNTVVRLERRGFFYEGKVLRRALVTLSTRGN
jgi:molecular chaperone GrpE (heat shock protein)